jgi:hypothetical protein
MFYPRAMFYNGSKYGIAVLIALLQVFLQLRLTSVKLYNSFMEESQAVNSSDIRDKTFKYARTASFQVLTSLSLFIIIPLYM